jgi:hypothetical protein
MTVLEAMVGLSVILLLLAIGVPRYRCHQLRAHMARALEDLRQARDKVESFEVEFGEFPGSLAQAYAGGIVPAGLQYCLEGSRQQREGSEECAMIEPLRGRGEGSQVVGYLLTTPRSLALCAQVDLAWTTCCGKPLSLVAPGEVD